MDPTLRKQLRQTIYVATFTSVDGGNTPTYGTPAAVSARVVPTNGISTNAEGEEVVTTHQIVTAVEIKASDRIWLPGDATTTANARQPVSVTKGVDEFGNNDHWETSL